MMTGGSRTGLGLRIRPPNMNVADPASCIPSYEGNHAAMGGYTRLLRENQSPHGTNRKTCFPGQSITLRVRKVGIVGESSALAKPCTSQLREELANFD